MLKRGKLSSSQFKGICRWRLSVTVLSERCPPGAEVLYLLLCGEPHFSAALFLLLVLGFFQDIRNCSAQADVHQLPAWKGPWSCRAAPCATSRQ